MLIAVILALHCTNDTNYIEMLLKDQHHNLLSYWKLRGVSLFTENCSIPLNGSEFDPGAVEFVNGTKSDGRTICGRFKSHPKDKDKRK